MSCFRPIKERKPANNQERRLQNAYIENGVRYCRVCHRPLERLDFDVNKKPIKGPFPEMCECQIVEFEELEDLLSELKKKKRN